MSVFSELDEIRSELDTILTDVLSSVLAEEALPTDDELPAGPLVLARLAIHDELGDSYAVVEVTVGVALARLIAARMMSVAAPSPDDVIDAVAEIGNIAGGNVKTLLCLHARMSLPKSEITDAAANSEQLSDSAAAHVRAIVLGHVSQLVVHPDAATDGLTWPPFTPDEIPERST
jgi:hypothetical protein